MLSVGLLGPVTAWRDEAELRLRGTRQRALLAALALDAGRTVATDVLLERVWGEQLPARPGNALQQQVLKLRRVLGDDALVFDAPGYRLAIAAGAVDSERLEQLVERGRAQLDSAPRRAEAILDEALALWRGPALADFAYDAWAAGPAARLDELRLHAEELRADAVLRGGRCAEAAVALKRLVQAEPLREHPHALLMLALYRDGRQAEALEAYTEARTQLVDELGVEPSTELRTLHERILRQDPLLEQAAITDPPAREAPRIPAALARHAETSTFVGRANELATLEQAWGGASAGNLTALFLSGEPGAGKTRLVAELAALAAASGGQVVYTRVDEEVPAPYGPFASALAQLAEAVSPDILERHIAEHGGELARLLPSLSSRVARLPAPASADPDTERMRLHDAVLSLLVDAAAAEPLMLVLDDIHAADRASLALLLHLVRGTDAPLLVVATYRGTEIDQRPPLRALLPDLLREPACRHLELGGLSEQDVAELVEATLGRSEAGMGQAIHRETEGNALFATELLRHVAEQGRLGEVPPTLRQLVLQRLELIGGVAAHALPAATVVGSAFDGETIARLTDIGDDEVFAALERARDAALIVESGTVPGRFYFAHAIIRAALAQALPGTRRRQLHRRRAEELETFAPHDARRLWELARHLMGCRENGRAIVAAIGAGDAALALLAPDEALGWYQQALELHEEQPDGGELGRAQLLVKLGEAERRAGGDRFRELLLEAGRIAWRLGDADLLARAALANNRGMHSRTGFVDHARIELLEAALDLRAGQEDELRALLLATTSSELWSGDHDRRHELSDEALRVARAAGDTRVLAEVIYRRAFALAEPSTLGERLDLTRELVELGDRLGDPLLRLLASVERSRAAIESGDIDEALAHAARQRTLAAECGDAYGRHGAGWAQGWPHVLAGRYDEAERAAEQALAESLASDQPDALAFYGAQLASIRWDQDRLGELADAILMHAQSPEGLEAHRALAALALAEAGRPAEANKLIDDALAAEFPVPLDTVWLSATMLWADACIVCERRDAAPLLLERLLPWRDHVAFTGLAVYGAVARVAAELAALAGRSEAGELFAQAEAIHRRIGAPAFLARTRAGWARWLVDNGEPARAAEVCETAREAAVACGCPHLAPARAAA